MLSRIQLYIVLITCKYVLSVNILYMAGIASPSHHIWNSALAKSMAERGHNVTYYSPDKDQPQTNYHPVIISGIYDKMDTNYHQLKQNPIQNILYVSNWLTSICRDTIQSLFDQHTELFLLSSQFFDTLIIDITFPCFYPLIEHFKFPTVIGVTPFLLPSHVAFNFAGQINPSTVPWYNLPYSPKMTMWQKIYNSFLQYLDILHYNHVTKYRIQQQWAQHNIKYDINAAERHISLVLSNVDPILSYPQALPPNIIAVGGLHLFRNRSVGDASLQAVMDNSINGFIVLSFGTNIQGNAFGACRIQRLLDKFAQLPQTVIWKMESNLTLRIPPNVHLRSFLPQANLLAHMNAKLFIGHGGALSTHEAIFYGVPMICIPYLWDQVGNCHLVKSRGLGMQINRMNVVEQLVPAIRFIINDPQQRHKISMQTVSQRYRDQGSALDRALFWMEYAIKHKGAHFFEPQQRHLRFYDATEFYIIVIMNMIILLLIIVFKGCRFNVKSKKHKKL